jgi:hypothetical protein
MNRSGTYFISDSLDSGSVYDVYLSSATLVYVLVLADPRTRLPVCVCLYFKSKLKVRSSYLGFESFRSTEIRSNSEEKLVGPLESPLSFSTHFSVRQLQKIDPLHKHLLNPHSFHKAVTMCQYTTVLPSECTMDATNLASPVKKSRRKRFRFAPETSQVVGTVLSRDDYTDEEINNCWWSKEMRRMFRSSAKNTIETAVAHMDSDMIYLLDGSYQFAQDLAGSLYTDDIKEILQDPSSHTRRLEIWSKKGTSACGLERFISKVQSLERKADYVRFRRSVVYMSKTTRTAEEIAEVAIQLSVTSRIYARMVGHAEAQNAARKALRDHTIVVSPESKEKAPLTKRSSRRRLMRSRKVAPEVLLHRPHDE